MENDPVILRHIRAHVGHHNWFAVAIDLAIVVIGVFIGTQANNWNQGRIDRGRAREERQMLLQDLHANEGNLEMRKHYLGWVRGEALKALGEVSGPQGGLGEQFLISSYQASQILPWSFQRNTYDQLLATGDIANIGDADLRGRVATFYAGTEVTGANLATQPPYRETLRRIMPYAAQQLIRGRCGEKISENAEGEPVMILPGACTLGMRPDAVRQAVRQVYGTTGLGLDLNRQLVDLDQKLISIDVILRRSRALGAAIRKVS